MSEEGVLYADLKLPKSNKPKEKRSPAHRKKGHGFPWQIVTVILGILCFFLLLATSAFGYMFFQRSCNCGIVTFTEENNNFSTEAENHSPLPTPADKQCPSDMRHREGFCCVKTCYYISSEAKTWGESKKSCEDLGARLVSIDDNEEQNFIQSKIKSDYWIGLRKKYGSQTWLWLNDEALSRHLNLVIYSQRQTERGEECGFIRPSYVSNAYCNRQIHYICKRKFYQDNKTNY